MTCRLEDIDALLPQTQCGDCGFKGCLPYAKAIVALEAPIDKCPPGGVQTMEAIAALLKIDPSPYRASAEANIRLPSIASIREPECIGCTKCIQACPVDAIVGARKLMHVVITEDCTGCGLCVDPCPVDCIDLLPIEKPLYDRERARRQHQAKEKRRNEEARELRKSYLEQKRELNAQSVDRESKNNYIAQLLARKKIGLGDCE